MSTNCHEAIAIFGLNTEKYGPGKSPYLDIFHGVAFVGLVRRCYSFPILLNLLLYILISSEDVSCDRIKQNYVTVCSYHVT